MEEYLHIIILLFFLDGKIAQANYLAALIETFFCSFKHLLIDNQFYFCVHLVVKARHFTCPCRHLHPAISPLPPDPLHLLLQYPFLLHNNSGCWPVKEALGLMAIAPVPLHLIHSPLAAPHLIFRQI